MDDVVLKVQKKPEDCMIIFKNKFLNRYDLFDDFNIRSGEERLNNVRYVYVENLREQRLLFKINRLGFPSIKAFGIMTECDANEIEIEFTFKENILIILFCLINCAMIFIFSLFIFGNNLMGLIFGEVALKDILFVFPIAFVLIFYSFFWPISYAKFRQTDRKNFIRKIKSELSVID